MGLVPALEPGLDISIQSNTSSSARWREVRQLRSSSLGTIGDIYNHVVRCSWHCIVCAVWSQGPVSKPIYLPTQLAELQIDGSYQASNIDIL